MRCRRFISRDLLGRCLSRRYRVRQILVCIHPSGLREFGAAILFGLRCIRQRLRVEGGRRSKSDEEERRIAEPALRYFFTLSARGFNEAVNERAADREKLNAALNSARSFSYFREENRPRIDFS